MESRWPAKTAHVAAAADHLGRTGKLLAFKLPPIGGGSEEAGRGSSGEEEEQLLPAEAPLSLKDKPATAPAKSTQRSTQPAKSTQLQLDDGRQSRSRHRQALGILELPQGAGPRPGTAAAVAEEAIAGIRFDSVNTPMLQRRYGHAGHHKAKAADGSALALQLALKGPEEWGGAEYEAALQRVVEEDRVRKRAELERLPLALPPPRGPSPEEIQRRVLALMRFRPTWAPEGEFARRERERKEEEARARSQARREAREQEDAATLIQAMQRGKMERRKRADDKAARRQAQRDAIAKAEDEADAIFAAARREAAAKAAAEEEAARAARSAEEQAQHQAEERARTAAAAAKAAAEAEAVAAAEATAALRAMRLGGDAPPIPPSMRRYTRPRDLAENPVRQRSCF
eukprot:SAG22_NODE_72_length_22344_cov_95.586559_14_plen_401_part_00